MPYLEHYGCFVREKPADSPLTERIGFMDIESSNLKASFGIVLSYCIKEAGGNLISNVITPAELRDGIFDKRLLEEFNRDLKPFHRIVVYWGKDRRHDLPFLRTRALKWGIPFPLYKEIFVVDLYDWARNKLSLHSYRLETVCRELGIPAKEHPLTGEIWIKALAGDKEALNYILIHNQEDVICLEPLYKRLEPFVRNSKVSI